MHMENHLEKIGQNSFMDNFVKTDDVLKDMCEIIESSRQAAYKAVNVSLVQRNWLIGYRISEEEFKGEAHSEYGADVIKNCQRVLRRSIARDLRRQICIAFIPSTSASPEFSRHRLENLPIYCLGRIMRYCCRLRIRLLVTGTRRRC